MTYHINIFKFMFSMDDHLYRVRETERLQGIWKVSSFLLLGSIVIYTWMALLGIGSDFISEGAVTLNPIEYEHGKLWFVIGRMGYGVLFTAFILFVPSLLFYFLTGIDYWKLVVMQQVVLLVLLVERLIWIPLAVYAGLEWYVSPLSLGVITSYITNIPWILYFFGMISLFQVWIIWFQVKYISTLADVPKRWLLLITVILHVIGWSFVALFEVLNSYVVSGWIG